MKKIVLGLSALCLLMACGARETNAPENNEAEKQTENISNIDTKIDETETSGAPSPADGTYVKVNPPRFMWPDKFPHLGPVLDGVPGQVDEEAKSSLPDSYLPRQEFSERCPYR